MLSSGASLVLHFGSTLGLQPEFVLPPTHLERMRLRQEAPSDPCESREFVQSPRRDRTALVLARTPLNSRNYYRSAADRGGISKWCGAVCQRGVLEARGWRRLIADVRRHCNLSPMLHLHSLRRTTRWRLLLHDS
ncbi:hypothetical protein EDB84DRAFT_412238 [Lactarius hengduanensis]|nr:hypothetical protein EDB84DRAFT_412238 [Lactarius hengduanensis]